MKWLPCHLPGVMGRRGTTHHLPCPACLVNTPWVRSLMNTALFCSYRHITQTTPNQGDGVSLYRQAQPQGSFFSNQSDCCSAIDPGMNKMPKLFNFSTISQFLVLKTKNNQHSARQRFMCWCFPASHPSHLGLTKLFQGFFPSTKLDLFYSGCA